MGGVIRKLMMSCFILLKKNWIFTPEILVQKKDKTKKNIP